MFSSGSVVNLCSVNSLSCTSPNLDGVLITVPIGNRLDKAKLSLEKLVNYESLFVRRGVICTLLSLFVYLRMSVFTLRIFI